MFEQPRHALRLYAHPCLQARPPWVGTHHGIRGKGTRTCSHRTVHAPRHLPGSGRASFSPLQLCLRPRWCWRVVRGHMMHGHTFALVARLWCHHLPIRPLQPTRQPTCHTHMRPHREVGPCIRFCLELTQASLQAIRLTHFSRSKLIVCMKPTVLPLNGWRSRERWRRRRRRGGREAGIS